MTRLVRLRCAACGEQVGAVDRDADVLTVLQVGRMRDRWGRWHNTTGERRIVDPRDPSRALIREALGDVGMRWECRGCPTWLHFYEVVDLATALDLWDLTGSRRPST